MSKIVRFIILSRQNISGKVSLMVFLRKFIEFYQWYITIIEFMNFCVLSCCFQNTDNNSENGISENN